MKINIVTVGRNDNYDECNEYVESYTREMVKFLEFKKEKYNSMEYEIFFVEWNYLQNRETLSEKIMRVTDKAKCVFVSNNIHNLIFKGNYQFLEMEARRIGGIVASKEDYDWIVFKSLESIWIKDGFPIDWIDEIMVHSQTLKSKVLFLHHKDIDKELYLKNNKIKTLKENIGWTNGGDFYCIHKDIFSGILKEYPSVILENVDGQPKQEQIMDIYLNGKSVGYYRLTGWNYHLGERSKGNNINKFDNWNELINTAKDITENMNSRNITEVYPMYFTIKTNDTVIIDIGASDGKVSKKLAESHPNTPLIAIEPNPEVIKLIPENFLKLQLCIGEEKKEVEYHLMKDSNTNSVLMPNYKKLPKFYKNWKTNEFVKENDWIPQKIIKINMDTISGIIERFKIKKIIFLKIDAQGYDLEVLKGIKDEDFNKIEWIQCEVSVIKEDVYINESNKEEIVCKFMEEKGYCLEYSNYQTLNQEKNLIWKRK